MSKSEVIKTCYNLMKCYNINTLFIASKTEKEINIIINTYLYNNLYNYKYFTCTDSEQMQNLLTLYKCLNVQVSLNKKIKIKWNSKIIHFYEINKFKIININYENNEYFYYLNSDYYVQYRYINDNEYKELGLLDIEICKENYLNFIFPKNLKIDIKTDELELPVFEIHGYTL
jgi:hypothetical protein